MQHNLHYLHLGNYMHHITLVIHKLTAGLHSVSDKVGIFKKSELINLKFPINNHLLNDKLEEFEVIIISILGTSFDLITCFFKNICDKIVF